MPPHLTLYGCAQSSCSARVRIALALKNLAYTSVNVDFGRKEQRGAAYAALNPSLSLPTLVVGTAGTEAAAAAGDLRITHPCDPNRTLEALGTLVAAVAPGTEINTTAVCQAWAHDFCVQALTAYEQLIAGQQQQQQQQQQKPQRCYSVGDAVSLADVCLVPAVWNATERWGVRLLPSFPTVARVYEHLMTLPAFRDDPWQHDSNRLTHEVDT
ncbi:maleylacetoacetate isomerase [Niveomyces insectorum RCEF 264]|uniref:Maleylacetoacetate isomerase n=1 Tax=Niveomyces insectorum RCEF 264 TaxID=1081102 RepID=A0A167RVK2_9HYPO|nr:maleylacetoacetate isomerase [Niveomyces insectorum RCEF 264]